MAIMLLCAVLGVAMLFPETPLGRVVRRVLIDPLTRMSPASMMAGFAVVVVVAGLIAYARAEGLMVVGGGLPDALAWFTMFDIATYIDVIALVALVAASVRLRAAYAALRSCAVRARAWLRLGVGAFRQGLGARARAHRPRPKASRPGGRDPDEPAPAFAFA
jgi:hypothetical protein